MISVVIPVYNVEKYLKECLDSVINQTYKELEIILVDDGSTDNSGKICDEYAKIDPRIKVVHQKNMGAGGAKNTGLDLISGDYFSLIDSDDYLEPNYYETLLKSMRKYDVDIVQCLFRNVFLNGFYNRKYNFNYDKNAVISSKKFLFELLYDWKYAIFFNKLFKTSLLSNIRFPVGRKIDDEFFTYKLIIKSKKILNVNDVLYNYRMRKSSVMNDNKKFELVLDRIDCYEERLAYIEKNKPKLFDEYYDNISNYILYNYNVFAKQGIHIPKEKLNKYPIKNKSIFSKILSRMLFTNYASDRIDSTDKEMFV